jgi:hypothetical protein
MVNNKENVMAEQAMTPRLLDMETAAGLLHNRPMSWGLFEDAAKTDPDLALLLPVWKKFVEVQDQLNDVITALRIKRADELLLK